MTPEKRQRKARHLRLRARKIARKRQARQAYQRKQNVAKNKSKRQITKRVPVPIKVQDLGGHNLVVEKPKNGVVDNKDGVAVK